VNKTGEKIGKKTENIFDKKYLESILELSLFCRRKKSSEATYVEILNRLKKIVPFDAATLFLINDHKKQLEEVASVGNRVEPLDFISIGKGEGISGWTVENMKPVLLTNRSMVSTFNPDYEYATFLSVPLPGGRDVIGVINFGCRAEQAFDKDDVTLVSLLTNQLGAAVEVMIWQNKISEYEKELVETRKKLKDSSINGALIEMINEIIELATGANHQINNPLSVIVGNVQCLLLEKYATNQKALSRLRRIEEAAVKIGDVNRKLVKIYSLTSEIESLRTCDSVTTQ